MNTVVGYSKGLLRRSVQHRSTGLGLRSARFAAVAAREQARVVVVGGGIVGTSVAYHLAEAGCKDVILLERDQLTSGTTWHAAGLMVTFGSLSETSTELRKYSKDLYSRLEEETGQSTGIKKCGFIELATETSDRLEEFRRVAAFNRKCGIDVQEISPSEVQSMFPLCDTENVLAGFYVEDDGRVNPVDVTTALAKGARNRGVRIIEGARVTKTLTDAARSRVTGVEYVLPGDSEELPRSIDAEFVVNCAGMWARQLGEQAGVSIPNQAAEHYYLITEAMDDVDPDWPVIEDPSSYTYIRPEGGGLMVGLFETTAAAWNVSQIPNDFSFGEIQPDWDRMAPFLEKAMSRVPRSLEVGAKSFFCGPESFTPDLSPLVGESPELRNYFVAAGMNSIGILTGGGIGRLVAHWILNGRPDMDVTGMNIDRVHPYQCNPEYRGARVEESLGMVYQLHYPNHQMKTARNNKVSPVHDRLAKRGAFFKDVSGWESPDWYAPEGVVPEIEKYSWNRENWFPYWESEHQACRNGVILMDMSFMSKFLVQGRDAGASLNWLSTANVDGDPETITYTQWLNADGKLEADLTVSKLAEDRFMVVASDTAHRHAESWMNRHFSNDAHVFVTDVTGGFAQLNLQGPRSRALLQELTDVDVSDESFPFRTIREISIGFAKVLCARITYLGELGYELYVPSEQALHVYDRVVEVGERGHGLTHAGLKALASLRIEKGYRDYGHDIDNTDTILEAGLGFTCDFGKDGGFLGRDRVLEQKARKGLRQRLVQILLKDPQPFMHHGEVVYRDGQVVGDIRAASYGHTLGGAVGLSMVVAPEGVPKITKAFVESGTWEVDVAGTRYPAVASLRPLYDPRNDRIKA